MDSQPPPSRQTPYETVTRFTEIFARIFNKFNLMNKTTYDFGTGDLLYPSEIHVLASIHGEDSLIITELAEKIGVTKSAASQVVKKLHRKGFLDKDKDPGNNKNIVLHLTEKGAKAAGWYQEFKRDLFADLITELDELNHHQVALIDRVLTRIDEHMDYKLEKYREMSGR